MVDAITQIEQAPHVDVAGCDDLFISMWLLDQPFNVGVHQIETVDITFSAQIAGLIEEEILDVLVGHAAAGIGVVGHHAVPLAVFDFTVPPLLLVKTGR